MIFLREHTHISFQYIQVYDKLANKKFPTTSCCSENVISKSYPVCVKTIQNGSVQPVKEVSILCLILLHHALQCCFVRPSLFRNSAQHPGLWPKLLKSEGLWPLRNNVIKHHIAESRIISDSFFFFPMC